MNDKHEHREREHKNPAEIEAEIGATRSVISQDLREIGEKLSSERLKEHAEMFAEEAKQKVKETAKETVTEITDAAVGKMRETRDRVVERVHEVTDSAVETATHAGEVTMTFVRENAVPLSLIGLGIGWLVASNRRRRSREEWIPPSRTRRFGTPSRRMRDYGPDYLEHDDYSGYEAGDRGISNDENGGIRAKAGQVMEDIHEKSHAMKERAQHVVEHGVERARDIGQRAQRGLVRAEERSRDFAMENPLVIGAAAVAAGVGIGLLLPSTSKEDELLGATRDRLIEGAKEGVEELGKGLKDATQEVRSAITQPTQAR